ncbi:hypothetical protein ACLKA7_017557 [Drosophila subpalustris]
MLVKSKKVEWKKWKMLLQGSDELLLTLWLPQQLLLHYGHGGSVSSAFGTGSRRLNAKPTTLSAAIKAAAQTPGTAVSVKTARHELENITKEKC